MKPQTLKALVYRDCRKAVRISTLLHFVGELIGGTIVILIADRLGSFADSIIGNNLSLGMEQVGSLLIYLMISILAVPAFGLLGNLALIKAAFTHEYMLLERYLDKTYETATTINEGEVSIRLEDDAVDLRCYWVLILSKLFSLPFRILFVLWFSLRIHLLFTVFVIMIALLKLLVPVLVHKLEGRYDQETREYNAQMKTYETEILRSPYMIKLLGLMQPFLTRIDSRYQEYYKKTFRRKALCTAAASQISTFLDTFCTLLILLVGALLVARGGIAAGSVAAMLGYFTVYNSIMKDVSYIIRKQPLMDNAAKRVELFYADFEATDHSDLPPVTRITASDLIYSFDDRTIFSGLNFEIHTGEKVAIVGENGSGKSTLLKILAGLLPGYGGKLLLNNAPLDPSAAAAWREQFTYAAQDPYLFGITMRENVHLGNLKASADEVDDILKQLGLDHLADRTVSLSQTELSGGEKQKISIARALLKKTPILLLDEPSNHLDADAVEWLADRLRSSPQTILYISHNPTLVELADQKIQL